MQKEQWQNMAEFVAVPLERLGADSLRNLLEEYASRDGTDYGERDVSLQQKVQSLHRQLQRGDLLLLYDIDSQQWDLVPNDRAARLLHT